MCADKPPLFDASLFSSNGTHVPRAYMSCAFSHEAVQNRTSKLPRVRCCAHCHQPGVRARQTHHVGRARLGGRCILPDCTFHASARDSIATLADTGCFRPPTFPISRWHQDTGRKPRNRQNRGRRKAGAAALPDKVPHPMQIGRRICWKTAKQTSQLTPRPKPPCFKPNVPRAYVLSHDVRIQTSFV